MTGKVVGKSLGYGYKGKVSRGPDTLIEANPVLSTSDDIPFGSPVIKGTDNTVSMPTASNVLSTTNFGGFAVAIIKQMSTYPQSTDGSGGAYKANQSCDRLRRGDIIQKCVHGTPAALGAVYARISLNGTFSGEAIGDIRADDDAGHCIVLPNVQFKTGYMDANNMVELTVLSANN